MYFGIACTLVVGVGCWLDLIYRLVVRLVEGGCLGWVGDVVLLLLFGWWLLTVVVVCLPMMCFVIVLPSF